MKTDRIFVLLLVVLLPMTGCFDDAVGDAEGTDEADGTSDTGDNGGTQTGDATNSQSRTWYSSGNVFSNYWDDNGAISGSSANCLDWGPAYSNSTGEYLGEQCRETGARTSAEQWNVSECTSVGGTAYWSSNDSWEFRYAPACIDIPLAMINTTSGQALLMYEFAGSNVVMESTCNGVTSIFPSYQLGYAYGNEYRIAEGSAMDCTHLISTSMQYSASETLDIWSIVYAIQDVTVV